MNNKQLLRQAESIISRMVEALGMLAENQKRLSCDQAVAYDYDDFCRLNEEPKVGPDKPEKADVGEEKEVSIECPECDKGTYHHFVPGHGERCKHCDGTGIQQAALTKEQAKLALDEGWIIQNESEKAEHLYYKHKGKYYLGRRNLSDEMVATTDNWFNSQGGGHRSYRIQYQAVTEKENLPNVEAFKLLFAGWHISAIGKSRQVFKYEEGVILRYFPEHNKWRPAGNICCKHMWDAKKYNYPFPKENPDGA